MREWVYKATETKVGFWETRHLAIVQHFLCRSAVEFDGSQADRVREVQIGDRIHFYYKQRNKPVSSYGTFEVIEGTAYPTRFGHQIPGMALFTVLETPENQDMIQRLTEEHDRDPSKGYERDPQHKCFTGWVIKRRSHAPNFDQKRMLPSSRTNLWFYPDDSLGRPGPKKP